MNDTQNTALAIIRMVVGLLMIYHGIEVFNETKMKMYLNWDLFKHLPARSLIIYSGKAAELIAGIMLLIGFYIRSASILLAVTMCLIIFFAGKGKIWYQDQHPFLFVLLAVVFYFMVPLKWSIDHQIKKRKK